MLINKKIKTYDSPFSQMKNVTYAISIHAPREGSDGQNQRASLRHTHFNPRSPRVERHSARIIARMAAVGVDGRPSVVGEEARQNDRAMGRFGSQEEINEKTFQKVFASREIFPSGDS